VANTASFPEAAALLLPRDLCIAAIERAARKEDVMSATITRRMFVTALGMLTIPVIALAAGQDDKDKKKEDAKKKAEDKKDDAKDKAKDAGDKADDAVDRPGSENGEDRRQDRRKDAVKN